MKQSSLPVIGLVLLVGCGGGGDDDVTLLDLEVVVGQDGVRLHAYEVERAFDCNQKVWLELGDCDETTDVFTCDGAPPAGCIDALRVEEDGVVVGEGIYDADFQDGYVMVDAAPTRDLELVVTGCGGEATFPIGATPPPVPVIVEATTVGADLVVQWSSDDATASGVVGWSSGFGGPRCHVERGQTATLRAPTGDPAVLDVYIQAYTAPVEHGSPLGIARVRTLGAVSEAL